MTHHGYEASSKNRMRNGPCSARGAAVEEAAGGVQSSHMCACVGDPAFTTVAFNGFFHTVVLIDSLPRSC